MLAQLKEPPFLDRDARGGGSDPRGFLHGAALGALDHLGLDAASEIAVFEFAFDRRNWDGDRGTALGLFATHVASPTPVQMRSLLEHAIHPKDYDDAANCGADRFRLDGRELDAESLALRLIESHGPRSRFRCVR